MKKQSLRCILIGSLFCLSACGAQAAPATASETKMSIQNTEKDKQENEKQAVIMQTLMTEEARKEKERQMQADIYQKIILDQTRRRPTIGRQSWVAMTPGSRRGVNSQQANSVLLIPNKPMDAEVIGQLVEDMQVMSMIFDEAANVAKGMMPGGFGGGGGGEGGGGALFVLNKHSLPPAEAIWLDGHGMIFTLAVDFPLVSIDGTEQEEQEVTEGKRDEVWQRSKNRLMGLDEPNEKKGEQKIVFDPGKVERLQKSLTEALKHAANISNLASKDKVIVAARSLIEGDNPYLIDPFTAEKAPVSVPTSVMTLQAEKQDIDAFSSGKIDLNAFTKKVTVVIY
ncbi:MAG: hypothetical protein ACYTEU_10510 [Planctomycetota bacterium]